MTIPCGQVCTCKCVFVNVLAMQNYLCVSLCWRGPDSQAQGFPLVQNTNNPQRAPICFNLWTLRSVEDTWCPLSWPIDTLNSNDLLCARENVCAYPFVH